MIVYVCEFADGHNLLDFEKSKTEIGRGVKLIIDEYTTKPETEKKAEYHRKYIDLQLMLSGTERFGYADLSRCTDKIPYDAEKEAGFVNGILDFCTLHTGSFALFYPNDVHMPGVQMADGPGSVKKAVFKIPV
jgi:biofilm protein TabA